MWNVAWSEMGVQNRDAMRYVKPERRLDRGSIAMCEVVVLNLREERN
jgi:hypothetical protein